MMKLFYPEVSRHLQSLFKKVVLFFLITLFHLPLIQSQRLHTSVHHRTDLNFNWESTSGTKSIAPFSSATKSSGQKKIVNPIAGSYGSEYIIVNYVDWGLLDTVKDGWNGSKTYNGHQGTDFVIRNFPQMDSGVNVLACDTGIVTFLIDSLFDKEIDGDVSKKLGNYIAIAHSGKLFSYYGHLKKNSIQVKVGDTVLPGQVIAEVGSSGNSTDPHLHFEWWYDSSILIDPFSSTYGNSFSYWKTQLPYDSSFSVWHSGISDDSLDLDRIRFQEEKLLDFAKDDSIIIINYWNLMYGLRQGDSIQIEWWNKNNQLWFQNTTYVPKDSWYYYYWNYIDFPPDSLFGDWRVVLKRNTTIIDEINFTTCKDSLQCNKGVPVGIEEANLANEKILIYPNPNQGYFRVQLQSKQEYSNLSLELFNINGKIVQSQKFNTMNEYINVSDIAKPGLYFLRISNNGSYLHSKKIIIQ